MCLLLKNRSLFSEKVLRHSLLLIVILCVIEFSSGESATPTKWLEFTHEKCKTENLTSTHVRTFGNMDRLYGRDGVFKMLVRFKGSMDGHVIVATNASADAPRYQVEIGADHNRLSQIYRIESEKNWKLGTRVSTPGILSELQFRGFLITYDPRLSLLSVFGEGIEEALMQFNDTTDSLQIHYFGFATWRNRFVQVAFNCVPKDAHSTVDLLQQGVNANVYRNT